jgi:hypothetical protein
VGTDAAQRGDDRRAAQARSAGTSGVSARRYGASRGLGGRQGGLSHQCRGRGDAMASGGLRGTVSFLFGY